MRVGDILSHVPMSDVIFSKEDIAYYNKLGMRQTILQLLQASYMICSAYMVWMLVAVICNTKSPIVVVLSESMYPGFDRGDILLLAKMRSEYYAGDICVFQLADEDIPIVHRVIDKLYSKTPIAGCEATTKNPLANHFQYMTKGDNNRSNDIFLYREKGLRYINSKHMGTVVYASFPLLGMVTIWTGYWKWLKYVIIGILAIDVAFTRDNTIKIARLDEKEKKQESEEEEEKEKKKKKEKQE
ncbi:signal peptidase, endoplasmic reticulum-type [Nematocida sp. ERTm5]|nr:signal peptidase I [Nematocida sp. AWRm79]KAI5182835.1 signal peptidase I [Nematocida sp. AWRm78]OAG31491.1 signal peptidase, endoplasmic reticulum-type [Nematocida sp. ERTm5]